MTPRHSSRTKIVAASASAIAIAALVTPLAAATAAGGGGAATPVHAAKPAPKVANAEHARISPNVLKQLSHKGPLTVVLQLAATSGTKAFASNRSHGAAAARTAQRSAAAKVDSAERALLPKIAAQHATVLYRTTQVLSGIAVQTDAAHIRALAALPGVSQVLPLTAKHLDNAHAVTVSKAPDAWAAGDTGEGVKIAVIDTGLDYTHKDFGGPGTVPAYDDAKSAPNNVELTGAAAAAPSPTSCSLAGLASVDADINRAKVVDGCDFAGDSYDGGLDSNGNVDAAGAIPHPDANPLDCPGDLPGGEEGHGSHVSGSAAGFGILKAGGANPASYATYNESDYAIGPGTAPKASLIGLRVFGCSGGTFLVSEALDWVAAYNLTHTGTGAAAPIKVLNLSLGSDFNPGDDPDATALGALTATGVLPVTSAGNSDDQYGVAGSPGASPDVLTVAASDDNFAVVDAIPVTPAVDATTTLPGQFSAQFPYSTHPTPVTAAVAIPADPTACTAAAASSLTGKIALIQAAAFTCGSATKFNNVQAGGAIGALIIDDDDSGSGSINGNGPTSNPPAPDGIGIPGAIVPKTLGDDLATAVGVGTETVTLDHSLHNTSTYVAPNDTTDSPASFTSRGGTYSDGVLKPDVSAPGVTIFSVDAGTGTEGHTLSGTSMASPHTAGIVVDVAAAHPTWTPGEIKAAVMNTATDDIVEGPNSPDPGTVYSPTRVGTGRVRADLATTTDVVAFAGTNEVHGPVSLGYGPVAVTDPTVTIPKTVTVKNLSPSSSHTYSISYHSVDHVPGVAVTVDPTSVTVGGGETKTITVSVTLTRATLAKVTDPTRDQTDTDLTTLAEETGHVDFSAADASPDLRVALAIAPRPASTMHTPTTLAMPAGTGDAPLGLTGTPVNNNGYESVAAGFQLGATSGELPACAASATSTDSCILFPSEKAGDVKYTGAAVQDGLLEFAVSTYAPWKTPSWAPFGTQGPGGDVIYSVYVNSPLDANGDHTSGYVVRAERFPGVDADDLYAVTYALGPNGAFGISTNDIVDIEYINAAVPTNLDTDLLNSDSMILPVDPTLIGNPSTITYSVETDSFDDDGGPLDTTATSTFDVAHPALTVGLASLSVDQPQTYLNVHRDVTDTTQTNANKILLLHLHNTDGNRADIVTVQSPQTITFGSVANHNVGDAPFTVGPTSSSGLPVTVTAAPSPVCAASGTNGTTITVLSAGTCTLTATQAGNDAYSAATPVTQSFTVAAIPGVTLTPFPGPHVTGEPIPVVVSIGADGATGTVTIKTGTTTLGTGTVSSSVAVVTLPGQHAGSYPLVATFQATSPNPGGTSAPVTVTVGKGKTTTAASAPAKQTGHQVKVSVQVKAVSPAVGPVTGTVVIASGKARATLTLKGGKASGKLKLGKGTHTITVTYKGSADFGRSSVKKRVVITK